jgi:hypothetical protein
MNAQTLTVVVDVMFKSILMTPVISSTYAVNLERGILDKILYSVGNNDMFH